MSLNPPLPQPPLPTSPQLPLTFHAPVAAAQWALMTAAACLVDQHLAGSAAAGASTYVQSFLLTVVASTLVVAWREGRQRRAFLAGLQRAGSGKVCEAHVAAGCAAAPRSTHCAAPAVSQPARAGKIKATAPVPAQEKQGPLVQAKQLPVAESAEHGMAACSAAHEHAPRQQHAPPTGAHHPPPQPATPAAAQATTAASPAASSDCEPQQAASTGEPPAGAEAVPQECSAPAPPATLAVALADVHARAVAIAAAGGPMCSSLYSDWRQRHSGEQQGTRATISIKVGGSTAQCRKVTRHDASVVQCPIMPSRGTQALRSPDAK